MRKKPFTFNEHVQLAVDLDGMRSTLMQHNTRLSEPYGKTSRQVRCVQKMLKSIDSLRSEMDNVFCREYPGEEYRKPHYEWIHTPYYNPENQKRIRGDIRGLNRND
jgi:hypothetical protein